MYTQRQTIMHTIHDFNSKANVMDHIGFSQHTIKSVPANAAPHTAPHNAQLPHKRNRKRNRTQNRTQKPLIQIKEEVLKQRQQQTTTAISFFKMLEYDFVTGRMITRFMDFGLFFFLFFFF